MLLPAKLQCDYCLGFSEPIRTSYNSPIPPFGWITVLSQGEPERHFCCSHCQQAWEMDRDGVQAEAQHDG